MIKHSAYIFLLAAVSCNNSDTNKQKSNVPVTPAKDTIAITKDSVPTSSTKPVAMDKSAPNNIQIDEDNVEKAS